MREGRCRRCRRKRPRLRSNAPDNDCRSSEVRGGERARGECFFNVGRPGCAGRSSRGSSPGGAREFRQEALKKNRNRVTARKTLPHQNSHQAKREKARPLIPGTSKGQQKPCKNEQTDLRGISPQGTAFRLLRNSSVTFFQGRGSGRSEGISCAGERSLAKLKALCVRERAASPWDKYGI